MLSYTKKVLAKIDIYHIVMSYFRKGNTEKKNESSSKYKTPPRYRSRLFSNDFKNANERDRRQNKESLPSRLPKTFARKRSPSQILLLGSIADRSSPSRSKGIEKVSTLGSTSNLYHATNEGFDPGFPETSAMRGKREDLIPRFPNLSTHGSSDPRFRNLSARSNSDPAFRFHSATEDLLLMPANDALESRGSSRQSQFNNERHSDTDTPIYTNCYNLPKSEIRGRRLNSAPKNLLSGLPDFRAPVRTPSQISLLDYNTDRSTPYGSKEIPRNQGSSTNLHIGGIHKKRRNMAMDFHHIPSRKSSESSFEFQSAAGDQLDVHNSSESYDPLNTRHFRNNPQHPVSGCTYACKRGCSKIPILNQGRRINPRSADFVPFSHTQRGKHTLTSAPKRNSYGMATPQGNANLIDDIQFHGIANWITFRNDTSVKFERIFKSLSKRKHNTGNVIDSTTHAHWMRLAGITADKDANMFKNFAGGKVILTFGEYKFLIHKICTAHDLDYWDVMRKMATFQEEELHPENGVALL